MANLNVLWDKWDKKSIIKDLNLLGLILLLMMYEEKDEWSLVDCYR